MVDITTSSLRHRQPLAFIFRFFEFSLFYNSCFLLAEKFVGSDAAGETILGRTGDEWRRGEEAEGIKRLAEDGRKTMKARAGGERMEEERSQARGRYNGPKRKAHGLAMQPSALVEGAAEGRWPDESARGRRAETRPISGAQRRWLAAAAGLLRNMQRTGPDWAMRRSQSRNRQALAAARNSSQKQQQQKQQQQPAAGRNQQRAAGHPSIHPTPFRRARFAPRLLRGADRLPAAGWPRQPCEAMHGRQPCRRKSAGR